MSDAMQTIQSFVQGVLGQDPDWKKLFLFGMTPVFILAILIEFHVARKRGRHFSVRDIGVNLALGMSYQVFEVVVALLVTGVVFSWVFTHRLFDVPVNAWTILPIFLALEFSYYWFHRASHRIRWFWSAHVPHHSGETMNFSTAARQSLLNAFVGNFIFYLPLVWLGVSPEVVGFLLALDLAYQYFVHTESVGRLPAWFEHVFNTPSHHRVHHGRNPEYIDKNYGGVLIIFDRWFGTHAEEVAKVDYGITQQIRSNNFLVLNVHEMVDMLRDVLSPGPWRQRLKHLLMPPDWRRPGHTPVRTWQTEER